MDNAVPAVCGILLPRMRAVVARHGMDRLYNPTSSDQLPPDRVIVTQMPVRRRFKIPLALHSAHPPVGGLTVTTAATPNRLAMLDGMCSSWVGPLVVAVWLPIPAPGVGKPRNYTDLAALESEVQAVFDRCDLRLPIWPCRSVAATQRV